ncbi:hypothetical protein SETIT_4G204400v2 [Setaria italica]|uniref:Uncharacterized protein n=1 Tax=Setaria italica TaxID=4555 RepID=A0A368QWQ9_SETIT|nr:hypothetical protein SETIT_4G204400v2 [Setaria italica]
MTGHCAPACHCACSASTFVPIMYNPALFSTVTSSSTRSSRPSPASSSSSSPAAAPLLVPKPKPVDAEDDPDCSCPGWLCGIGLVSLVLAAVVILVVMFV